MRTALTIACGLLVAALAAAPAPALGPVDGEVGAVWWANEHEVQSVTTTRGDGDAPGLRAELWLLQRYGMRAARFDSDTDVSGFDGASYTSFDVMWRAFAPVESSFFAVGLGWEDMDLDSLGLDGSTSGPRLSVEGRVGLLGALYAYGQGTYLPALDDTPAADPLAGTFKDLSGHEYELGVSWTMMPFVALRAGYRVNNVDFNQVLPGTVGTTAEPNAGRSEAPAGTQAISLSPLPPVPGACNPCAASTGGGPGTAESSGFFAGLTVKF